MELKEKPTEANATPTRDTVKPQAKSPAQQPAQQPTKTVVKIVSSPPPQPPAVKKASPPPAQQPAKQAVKKASPPPAQQTAKPAVKKASTPPVQQPAVKKASSPPVQQPVKQAVKKASPPPAQQPMVKKASPPAEIAGADDADAFIETHVHAMLPGTLNIHRMRFQKGSTSASYSTEVSKGKHEEYVLRARRDQRMGISLQCENSDVYFRVFLRDGDISGQRRSWNGTLPRYGDYHVVVYLKNGSRSTGEVPCTLTVSIE
jgi:hypothetical protein